jgi:hypothetical protein
MIVATTNKKNKDNPYTFGAAGKKPATRRITIVPVASWGPAGLLLRQVNMSKVVMPDLIRHPVLLWIPAFAGMTVLAFMVAGVITGRKNRRRRSASAVFPKNREGPSMRPLL